MIEMNKLTQYLLLQNDLLLFKIICFLNNLQTKLMNIPLSKKKKKNLYHTAEWDHK